MEVRLFGAYGILGHEKLPVFTVARDGEIRNGFQDELIVEIPYPMYETADGEIAVSIGGEDWLLNDMLANAGHDPCLNVPFGRNGAMSVPLEVISRVG